MNNSETSFDRLCWTAGSILAVCYALTPIVWIVSLSLKPPADLGDNRFWPQHITFEHYRAIFHRCAVSRRPVELAWYCSAFNGPGYSDCHVCRLCCRQAQIFRTQDIHGLCLIHRHVSAGIHNRSAVQHLAFYRSL